MYLLQQWAGLRHDGLSLSDFTDDHDPYTFRFLETLPIAKGATCLDVGAGGGSVARWLLDRVCPGGRVVAVDVDEATLREGLTGTAAELLLLDVTREGLLEGQFDLVHSRLMLCNLVERDRVLDQLVQAARPGGTVVLADLDFTKHRPAFVEPAWNRAWPAFLDGLVQAGWDPAFGSRLVALLESQRLEQVQAETVSRYVRGGSLTCRMTLKALERGAHVMDALAEEDVDRLRGPLDDPGRAFVAPDYTIAWGRRPRQLG